MPCRLAVDTSKAARFEIPADANEKFEQCIKQAKFCASKRFMMDDRQFVLGPCDKNAAVPGTSLECWSSPGYDGLICQDWVDSTKVQTTLDGNMVEKILNDTDVWTVVDSPCTHVYESSPGEAGGFWGGFALGTAFSGLCMCTAAMLGLSLDCLRKKPGNQHTPLSTNPGV